MPWWNPLSWFGDGRDAKGEPVVVPPGGDMLVGGDQELRASMVKLRAYADGVIEAIDVLNETAPEDKPAESADVIGWKNSVRNRVLAGSGDKAAFFGTLSTEPVVTAHDLENLGLDAGTAADLIVSRDELRAAALSMAPIVEE